MDISDPKSIQKMKHQQKFEYVWMHKIIVWLYHYGSADNSIL